MVDVNRPDFTRQVFGSLQNDVKRFFTSFRENNYYLLVTEFDERYFYCYLARLAESLLSNLLTTIKKSFTFYLGAREAKNWGLKKVDYQSPALFWGQLIIILS